MNLLAYLSKVQSSAGIELYFLTPYFKNGTILEFPVAILKPVTMKISLLLSLLLLSLILTSCGAIETIFKAGMWWAIILIAIVVGVILYFIAKTRKK